jgi:hypothetical protein
MNDVKRSTGAALWARKSNSKAAKLAAREVRSFSPGEDRPSRPE